ncbi:MAG TPA: hypothetical protein PKV98_04625 [Burkholderiaceae bacterium]|nr:hypothetical protein [Burkholderiaceae bacterium]
MEIYPRESRPEPGVPGRVIGELYGPERPGCITILYDDGNNWVPSDPFPSAPLGEARQLREDMKWVYAADPYRNILVDGGFEVWQGPRTYVLPGVSQLCQGCDMWSEGQLSVPGNFTVSRVAGLSTGSRYALRWQRTAGTNTATFCSLTALSETALCLRAAGQRLTLSFLVRGGANFKGTSINGTGKNLRVAIATGTGTDEGTFAAWTGQVNFDSYFQVTPGVVQRCQTTITVPSGAAELGVTFIWAHDVAAAGASDYIEFDDVQMEVNDIATPFERLPFDVTLERVQRYRQKSFLYDTAPAQNAGYGGCINFYADVAGVGLALTPPIQFAPRMRTAPVMTYYNPAAANAFVFNVTLGTSATTTFSANAGDRGITTAFNGLAAWAVGNSLAVNWSADARL